MFHNHIVESLPQADALEWQPLSPKYPRQELAKALLFALVLLLAALALPVLVGHGWLLALSLPAALLLGGLLCLHRHRLAITFGYLVRERDIQSLGGVIWRAQTALSYCRIQHIAIEQGPWERHLGLATLNLFSAGSSSAELVIPGLEEAEAQRLRQWLLARIDRHD
ncbi:PH domain-containing protein [Gallaecimonas xiamenensis]|uniref:Membrane-flanked domain-containing protein n=1 Tax=Gallaecimonas xiamenensis 3-C-1 TaxID=745411 RepID=K2KEJ8_9GAMM|nr:PH domain-containing protein [Gallaecimonas xiamenensis]EKE75715.1 membrane-flanked domain-containing protein [Gallaecimonas xiamenensis 3-C-1]